MSSTFFFFGGATKLIGLGVCLVRSVYGILIRRPLDNTVQQQSREQHQHRFHQPAAPTPWLPTITRLSSSSLILFLLSFNRICTVEVQPILCHPNVFFSCLSPDRPAHFTRQVVIQTRPSPRHVCRFNFGMAIIWVWVKPGQASMLSAEAAAL